MLLHLVLDIRFCCKDCGIVKAVWEWFYLFVPLNYRVALSLNLGSIKYVF